jgi:hypothetical protein
MPRSALTSALPRRRALPPAADRLVPDHPRRNLDVAEGAKFPKFLGCAGVLIDALVDLERAEFSGIKGVYGYPDLTEKFAQLLLVVRSDCFASRPAI